MPFKWKNQIFEAFQNQESSSKNLALVLRPALASIFLNLKSNISASTQINGNKLRYLLMEDNIKPS